MHEIVVIDPASVTFRSEHERESRIPTINFAGHPTLKLLPDKAKLDARLIYKPTGETVVGVPVVYAEKYQVYCGIGMTLPAGLPIRDRENYRFEFSVREEPIEGGFVEVIDDSVTEALIRYGRYDAVDPPSSAAAPVPVAVPASVPTPPPPPVMRETAPHVSVLLGKTVQGRDGAEVFWTPDDLANYGVLVSGDSGFGKTQTLRAIIADVTKAGFPIMILDHKGDYLDMGLATYDVDRHGLPFNPLRLVGDEVQPIRHIIEFAGIMQRALGLGDIQMPTLKEAVATAFRNRGVTPSLRYKVADLPDAPTFAEVVKIIGEMPKTASLLARLSPLADMEMFPASDTVSFTDLLAGQIVIDLHALPSDQAKTLMAEFLVMRLHGQMLLGDQPRAFRRLIVIDEAHRLGQSDKLIALAREGRAFGVGIALGTQFPDDVPDEMSGNLQTKIALRNGQMKHARAAARMFSGGSAYDIARMKQFEAVVTGAGYGLVKLIPHFDRVST